MIIKKKKATLTLAVSIEVKGKLGCLGFQSVWGLRVVKYWWKTERLRFSVGLQVFCLYHTRCPAPLQSQDVTSGIFLPFFWYIFPLHFLFCWRLETLWEKYALFKVLLRSCILAGSTSLQLSLWSSRKRCQSSVASKCCSRHGREGPQCLQTLFSSTLQTKSPTSTFTPAWGETLGWALH